MSEPEENSDFSLLLWRKIKPFWLSLVFLFVGIALVSLAFYFILKDRQDNQSLIIEHSASESVNKAKQNIIKIDVEGAVLKPGVYELSADARVVDALKLSGGLAKNSDNNWIAKNLNLAAKLFDSAKLYIPFVDDQTSSLPPSPSTSSNSSFLSSSVLINLNAASQSELESLTGIGPVTSQKIIDNRPYEKIEDLLTKKVVGKSVFEKIKDKISVF